MEHLTAPPDVIRTATNLVPFEIKDVRIVNIVWLDQKAVEHARGFDPPVAASRW